MKLLATTAGAVLGLALALLSFPWVFYAMGRAMLGDDAGADAAFEACPLMQWWNWLEARRHVRV